MDKIREYLPKKLIELRKQNNLTQVELASKINYSDKAISRWEKGEVLPDLETLEMLSEVYDVPLSTFVEEKSEAPAIRTTKQDVLSQIFFVCSIWTIIATVFTYLNISKGQSVWQLFVWGVPATCFILLLLNERKNRKITNFVFGTIFVWSIILCIFLHLISSAPWYIFLIGIPLQGILVIRYLFNFKQKPIIKSINKKNNNKQI